MKKRSRFSIFFRGCNQHKFIHITAANVQIFLRQKSLYMKKVGIQKYSSSGNEVNRRECYYFVNS